jgi:hypothetical protein
MLRCVVSLSILNTLSIFTFYKLLTGTKMPKMFILSRPVSDDHLPTLLPPQPACPAFLLLKLVLMMDPEGFYGPLG